MLTSAHHLHMHPLDSSPMTELKAIWFFVLHPLTRRIPRDWTDCQTKAKKRADGLTTLARRMGTVRQGTELPESPPKTDSPNTPSLQIFLRMDDYATHSK